MVFNKSFCCLLVLFFASAASVWSQNITISLGPDEIALNEAFTITVTIRNERLSEYDGFPDIPGFTKRGTSSSTSTSIVNGKMSSTQSITQTYIAQREGSFVLKPFTMTVNGQEVSAPGKTIKVEPPKESTSNRYNPFGSDPFDDLFGRRNAPQEFVEVEADAFLALSTSKEEVYVGEGFTVTLAFYVAESNRAQLQFFDLGSQLADILKKVRCDNCWEENFNIESINRVPVSINGKRYQQYKLYQAVFYPLNLESIKFPGVGLKLIQYQEAKSPSFFGRNRKEDYEIFKTQPKTVKVKDLPPHPLKDQVSVGNYKLTEKIDKKELQTGEGLNYSMTIRGEGNISAVNNPAVRATNNFEFYDPNIRMSVNRNNGKVTGQKIFDFYAVPKEPGDYNLGNLVSWVYFSPEKEAYDTLRSNIVINVAGESLKNEYITSNEISGGFYDLINDKGNSLKQRSGGDIIKIVANVFIGLMLVLSGWVLFKK